MWKGSEVAHFGGGVVASHNLNPKQGDHPDIL